MAKDEKEMKAVIDAELKKVPIWQRGKKKRQMIEDFDAKISELSTEWRTNDQSLIDIKAEIGRQVDELTFQIEDALEQMFDIQTRLGEIEEELDDESDDESDDPAIIKKKANLHNEKGQLLRTHAQFNSDIQRMKDKKLSLLSKVSDAEREYEQRRGYIINNMRGLVECRTILERPKELPKWVERIPAELLKGVVAGGLLIIGLYVKEKMLDEGTSDKETEYFINNIGKINY